MCCPLWVAFSISGNTLLRRLYGERSHRFFLVFDISFLSTHHGVKPFQQSCAEINEVEQMVFAGLPTKGITTNMSNEKSNALRFLKVDLLPNIHLGNPSAYSLLTFLCLVARN